MKLSLRKAHVLVKNLERKIGVYNAKSTTIPYSTELEKIQADAEHRWKENQERLMMRLEISNIIFGIREMINTKNNEVLNGVSINALVHDKTSTESQMKILAEFSELTSAPSNSQRVEAAERQVRYKENSYEQTANIGGYSNESFILNNSMYHALKTNQQKVQDELAVLNNKLQVELKPEWIKVLSELQVL